MWWPFKRQAREEKPKYRTSEKIQAQREKMRGRCSGWDNPDERCPRKPSDCRCWNVERVN